MPSNDSAILLKELVDRRRVRLGLSTTCAAVLGLVDLGHAAAAVARLVGHLRLVVTVRSRRFLGRAKWKLDFDTPFFGAPLLPNRGMPLDDDAVLALLACRVSRRELTLVLGLEVVFEEALLPSRTELNDPGLGVFVLVHIVALRDGVIDVRLDPVWVEGVDDAPHEAPVGPAPDIHLFRRQVLAESGVRTD